MYHMSYRAEATSSRLIGVFKHACEMGDAPELGNQQARKARPGAELHTMRSHEPVVGKTRQVCCIRTAVVRFAAGMRTSPKASG